MHTMRLDAVQLDDNMTLLSMEGKLDADGVQKIESQFLEYTSNRKKPTVVNMADVSFLASLGIRMLMFSALALHRLGAKLVVLCPQPLVEKTLRATGMHAFIPISHDLEAAKDLAMNSKS